MLNEAIDYIVVIFTELIQTTKTVVCSNKKKGGVVTVNGRNALYHFVE